MTEEGPVLLVVDDSDDNRYTLVRRLRRQGHENILEAAGGREALELLYHQPVDLVLLDLMMPDVDGYEVLSTMKQDMDLREVPVIMISAADEIDNVVRCLELGAEDYLPKPFNPTVLNARVTASLDKRRLRRSEHAYLSQVEQEKARADRLLEAMVPLGAVNELRTSGTVRPRRYDNVAVLFCDIVGFTAYCDSTGPEEVVAGLDLQISRFEEIAERHRVEKIKTIGDAFMATAGLLVALKNPLKAAVDCGLEMVEAAATIEPHWQVRIGIHQGPVVAGITGARQFQFDLWGDTVNVAARISDKAEPGTVVVTAAQWPHLREHYRGRSLGTVPLKGKGDVELVECSAIS
jgi:class 3 adenylate cyclase